MLLFIIWVYWCEHILPQMNDLNWKLFFPSYSLLSFKSSSKLQRKKKLLRYIFYIIFLVYFSALFLFSWMKILRNLREISNNSRHFHRVTIMEHTQMKTSDESGKKKSFFYIDSHSSDSNTIKCEIYNIIIFLPISLNYVLYFSLYLLTIHLIVSAPRASSSPLLSF